MNGAEPTQPLEIDVTRSDAALIVRLRGAATMDQTDALQERLLPLTTEVHPRLVLDLSALSFINSLGLGILVTAHVRCRRRGQPMLLVSPTPPVRQMLELTRLTDLFQVCRSVDEALAQA
jgi:anti-sigma B factor antagonist